MSRASLASTLVMALLLLLIFFDSHSYILNLPLTDVLPADSYKAAMKASRTHQVLWRHWHASLRSRPLSIELLMVGLFGRALSTVKSYVYSIHNLSVVGSISCIINLFNMKNKLNFRMALTWSGDYPCMSLAHLFWTFTLPDPWWDA